MRVNEIIDNKDRIIQKIDELYSIEEYNYNKLNRNTFFRKIINSQELVSIRKRLSNLDLLKRFVNGESFTLKQLITIATDESLMSDECFKNIVYSIRNKLSDIRGSNDEIKYQTQLNEYVYVEELAFDLEERKRQ